MLHDKRTVIVAISIAQINYLIALSGIQTVYSSEVFLVLARSSQNSVRPYTQEMSAKLPLTVFTRYVILQYIICLPSASDPATISEICGLNAQLSHAWKIS